MEQVEDALGRGWALASKTLFEQLLERLIEKRVLERSDAFEICQNAFDAFPLAGGTKIEEAARAQVHIVLDRYQPQLRA